MKKGGSYVQYENSALLRGKQSQNIQKQILKWPLAEKTSLL